MSLIGTGIDIVEIKQIERLLNRQREKFLERVFTEGEREYCTKKARPAIHLAARFAAKEAVAKALGTGFSQGIQMRDIEVVSSGSEQPHIHLHGAAAQRYNALHCTRILLSLSHTREYAVAHADIF
jgi:holo-[acyl-carrier protein] synthase